MGSIENLNVREEAHSEWLVQMLWRPYTQIKPRGGGSQGSALRIKYTRKCPNFKFPGVEAAANIAMCWEFESEPEHEFAASDINIKTIVKWPNILCVKEMQSNPDSKSTR